VRILQAYQALLWLLRRLSRSDSLVVPAWSPAEEKKKKRLIEYMRRALSQMGGYEPAFDDLLLEGIADMVILKSRLERDLEERRSSKVVENYMRVHDTLAKLQEKLAVNRTKRLGKDESETAEEVAKLMRNVFEKLRKIEMGEEKF